MKIQYKFYRLPDNKSRDYPTTGKPQKDHLKRYYRRKNEDGIHWSNFDLTRPTTKGGAVYCIVEDEFIKLITVAYCSMSDNFCYKIGKDIAYNRAMNQLTLVEGAE